MGYGYGLDSCMNFLMQFSYRAEIHIHHSDRVHVPGLMVRHRGYRIDQHSFGFVSWN